MNDREAQHVCPRCGHGLDFSHTLRFIDGLPNNKEKQPVLKCMVWGCKCMIYHIPDFIDAEQLV